MTGVRIRAASATDVSEFLGSMPGPSMRAIVAERQGEVLGIAGIYRQGDNQVAFSDLSEEILRYPMAIGRATRRLGRMIEATGIPTLAIEGPRIPTAPRLLEWAGFELIGNCSDGKVWSWRGLQQSPR